jgi:tRNA A-37 threonylcarbamoyl transferase component Bud32
MEAQGSEKRFELELLQEVNAGTFARLYLAQMRGAGGIERLVAVKLVREQWAAMDEVVTRTRDEARLLARLRHKNILRVEELTEIDGQAAIVMEYVEGLDLKQLQDALGSGGKRFSPKAALQIATQVASALEAAWAKIPLGMEAPLAVVHRDIKPSNIMVSVEGEVKVLDFGTARANEAFRAAKTGALRLGSLKYMSPERRDGNRGEHPGDMYALGLTLLELLRGNWLELLPLDEEEHDAEVVRAVNALDQTGMPNEEWDLALRRLLVRLMASNAAFRPDAAEAVTTLRAFADQASGASLETFAAEEVARLTLAVRGQAAKGSFSGRKLALKVEGASGPQGLSARGASGPQGAGSRDSGPQGSSRRAPPAEAGARVSTAAGTGAAARSSGPQGAGSEAPRPAIRGAVAGDAELRGREATGRKIGPGLPVSTAPLHSEGPPVERPVEGRRPPRVDRPVWGAALVPPPPPQADPALPTVKLAAPAPEPAPPAKSGSMVFAGMAVVVALGLAAVVIAAVAGGLWWSNHEQVPAEPVETPPDRPPKKVAKAAVRVEATGGTIQWIRLLDAQGKEAAKASDTLNTALPAGDYRLSIKYVGRSVVSGPVRLVDGGANFLCSLDKDGSGRCESGGTTILLPVSPN